MSVPQKPVRLHLAEMTAKVEQMRRIADEMTKAVQAIDASAETAPWIAVLSVMIGQQRNAADMLELAVTYWHEAHKLSTGHPPETERPKLTVVE